MNETAPKIPKPTFTAEIDTSGLSNLVKQAFTAGIVKAGIKAANNNGIKNLNKSPTKKISFTNLEDKSNINFLTKENVLKFKLKNTRNFERKSLNLLRKHQIRAIIS